LIIHYRFYVNYGLFISTDRYRSEILLHLIIHYRFYVNYGLFISTDRYRSEILLHLIIHYRFYVNYGLFISTDRYRSEILLHLIIHYSFYVILVFISKPENNVVTGLHEPVGPCQETVPVYTAFGHVSYTIITDSSYFT
jgi:hypothetical protein